MDIECARCGRKFYREETRPVPGASISGQIAGDEHTESYYFCEPCGVYTVVERVDRFMGDVEVSVGGPMPRRDGDEKVEIIERCPEPWNKRCRCEGHREYFGPRLD